jgi:hypothetical protein
MQRVLAGQLMRMNYQLAVMGRLQGDEAASREQVPLRMRASRDFLK